MPDETRPPVPLMASTTSERAAEAASFLAAIDALLPELRGRAAEVEQRGMVPYGMKIELHGYDFLRERRIQGSSMGSNRFRVDMPKLLNAWKKGHLKLDHLISSHIKLDEINEGYAKLKGGHVLRQLIDFGVAK